MWQGIEGHDAVVERFRRTLAQGRLASSYLFVGPEGIGKRTFALKLAESLLCQSSGAERLEPCGQCQSCRLMRPGHGSAIAENHPDVDFVQRPEGKQSLPIDLFIGDREHRHQTGLCHNIALRPMLGRRRVAIIDDADHLRQESANCLLKTLEEPPAGALLILIGTSRSRQLPTILSRTQVVRFSPLPEEVLGRLLLDLKIAADDAEAHMLATLGEGSIARAGQYADGELAALHERLLPQLTAERLNSVRLADELGRFVNEAGKEADRRRRRLRAIIQLVARHFRQRLRSGCDLALDGAGDTSANYRSQQQALAVLDRCIEAELQLDRNANQATLLACWLDDLATALD